VLLPWCWPKTVKGAQSDLNYVSRLLLDCVANVCRGSKIIVTPLTQMCLAAGLRPPWCMWCGNVPANILEPERRSANIIGHRWNANKTSRHTHTSTPLLLEVAPEIDIRRVFTRGWVGGSFRLQTSVIGSRSPCVHPTYFDLSTPLTPGPPQREG